MEQQPRGTVTLRAASPRDLALLSYWDTQPHVVASDPNDSWNWSQELGRKPPWREQLIAELNGEPVGYLEIIDPALEEEHYWGDQPPGLRAVDIWIGEARNLNRGIGHVMMRQALERCFAPADVHGVLIDPLASNPRALEFYKRFGFEFVEARRFGEDDCLVFKLTRDAWQLHTNP